MTSLTLDNLNLTYSGSNTNAVRDFSLQVNSSELITLLGPSGCGKTSTLKMIAGLVPPNSGDIRFDGQSVAHLPPERRQAAMVFQNHLLFPYLTVRQNVGFGLKMQRVAGAEIERKVDAMLESVQLGELGGNKPHEISGGQRQRAALARALVTEPQLLLLDEPLSSLDPHLRDEIRNLIIDLQRQTGTTTVMVTHDQDEALQISDRIALMFDGELSQFDYPTAFFERPANVTSARFFGCQNFLSGNVTGQKIVCSLGEIRLSATNTLTSTNPKRRVTAAFRAENLIVNPPGQTNNYCEVKLLAIEFAGSYRKCQVQVMACNGVALQPLGEQRVGTQATGNNEAVLQLHCHARDIGEYAVGEHMHLSIPPEAIWIMPD